MTRGRQPQDFGAFVDGETVVVEFRFGLDEVPPRYLLTRAEAARLARDLQRSQDEIAPPEKPPGAV